MIPREYLMHQFRFISASGGIMAHYAIILAGGTGSRMGLSIPKQFAMICGEPCISHTIRVFDTNPAIEGIILVSHPNHINEIASIAGRGHNRIRAIVPGGETRQESSYRGINAMNFSANDILLIHDSARPFVSKSIIDAVIAGAMERGAALPAIQPADTVFVRKGVNDIGGTLDRTNLLCAQTPQGFRASVIQEAHRVARENGASDATDDISLVIKNGIDPLVVEGSEMNIKITTPKDLACADSLLTCFLESNPL
jgi:2-C-methyl-D-erythritol 4-phosphate cytidylyltransferase